MQHPPHQPQQPGPVNGQGGPGAIIPISRPPAELVLPGVPGQESPKASSHERKILFAAFRRRWFLALSLGLIFGGISAGAAWYLVPAPYSTFAAFRMRVEQPSLLPGKPLSAENFRTYKETQMRLLKSPFVLAAALRAPGIAKLSIFDDVPYPVEWLEKNIQVSSPQTEFVHISLSGDEPAEITAVINAIYAAYLDEVVTSDQKSRVTRRDSLEVINRDLQSKLRTKENAVRKLAEALQTGDKEALTLKQQLALEYFGQLRKHHSEIQLDLMRAQTELAVVKSITPDSSQLDVTDQDVQVVMSQLPSIQELEAEVVRQELNLQRLRKVIPSAANPRVKAQMAAVAAAKKRLDDERAKLSEEVRVQLKKEIAARTNDRLSREQRKVELLSEQEKRLREDLDAQKVQVKRLGIESFEIESLKQEISQMKEMADNITDEIQVLTIELGADARTSGHREAQIPHQPDMGKKQKLSGMAGLGVFGLIVAAIVWLEYHARRISSLDEVVDGLSLRILGSLPVMPGWVSKGKRRGKASRHAVLRSVWTESIDATRTVLLRDARLESMKVVMICSAVGCEGKTTLSCHLATSLARSGRKTLLIDTDMRRSNLHKVFGVDQSPGFCEVVRGELPLHEVVRPLPTEGLYLLTAGKIDQKTLRILSSRGPEALFEQIKEEFDFTIVDSAPLLPVNDSLLIGQYVDAALFSIRRDVSRFGKVANACERLAMLGVPMLGAVVTGLDETSYGYRYPYRYYSYGGYGYNVHSDAAS